MTDDRTLPFPQRAHQNYLSEMEDLTTVEERLQTEDQEGIEEYREPLAIQERKVLIIELSAGGPADGYKIYFDEEGQAIEGFYYFADWFEYEEERLKKDELERVIEVYNLSL